MIRLDVSWIFPHVFWNWRIRNWKKINLSLTLTCVGMHHHNIRYGLLSLSWNFDCFFSPWFFLIFMYFCSAGIIVSSPFKPPSLISQASNKVLFFGMLYYWTLSRSFCSTNTNCIEYNFSWQLVLLKLDKIFYTFYGNPRFIIVFTTVYQFALSWTN